MITNESKTEHTSDILMVRLGDICTPKQWKTIAKKDLLDEGYPVYGANGIIGYYNEYNHTVDTICVTCRGATCGHINIAHGKSYINGNAMALDNLDDRVVLKFLVYYLSIRGFQDIITGSAQPQITKSSLEQLTIALPSLERQKEIVKILDQAQMIIEKRKSQLQLLNELKHSVFYKIFDLKSPCASKKIKELADITMGQSPDKNVLFTDFDKGVEFHQGIKFLKNGKLDLSEIYCADLSKKVAKGNIIIGVRAPVGDVFINPRDIVIGRGLAAIVPKSINRTFLFYTLKHNKNYFEHNATGSTFKAIKKSTIEELSVKIPDSEKQNTFSQYIHKIDDYIHKLEMSLDIFYTSRNSLEKEFLTIH